MSLPTTDSNPDHDIPQQLQLDCQQQTHCRILLPSLLNKSSIHTVNLSNSMLTEIPEHVASHTQKIDVSGNMLGIFPLGFGFLKEINISDNAVERMPEEINNMEFLRIIRANNNRISILPFLKCVHHLQLNNNPIKLLTTKLSQTRIRYLSFDWLFFLIVQNPIFDNNCNNQCNNNNRGQQIVNQLCDLIDKSRLDVIEQFVGFDVLFQTGVRGRNGSCGGFGMLVHRAVSKKIDFFIQFLKDCYPDVNYNALLYLDRPLLQQILQQKYDKALELYKLKRSNLNEPEVFMVNLILACKYNHMDFFNYVVKNGLKRHIIQQNEEQIIEVIFKNFDLDAGSQLQLVKILYLANYSKDNKKIFRLPRNYSIREADNISQGVLYVMKTQNQNQLFDFSFAIKEDILEPLLHFAMGSRKPELVQIILERYRSPFVTNFIGKMAKTIRGSILSRKLIRKYQKICVKQKLQQQNVSTKSLSPTKRLQDSWFQIMSPGKQGYESFGSIIKDEEPMCIAPKIHNIQKQIHKRNILPHRLKTHPKPKINMTSFSIPQLGNSQQIGVVYDYTINHDKSHSKKMLTINQRMSSLAIYETFQKTLANCFVKDYKTRQDVVEEKSFFYSPLRICQDVEFQEEDKQFYFTMRKGKIMKNQIDGDLCRSPCREVEHDQSSSLYNQG